VFPGKVGYSFVAETEWHKLLIGHWDKTMTVGPFVLFAKMFVKLTTGVNFTNIL